MNDDLNLDELEQIASSAPLFALDPAVALRLIALARKVERYERALREISQFPNMAPHLAQIARDVLEQKTEKK